MRDFTGGLTRHLRLRRTALPAEILAAWKRRHAADPSQAGRLEALLRVVTELRRRPASERQLLLHARALDAFRLEVPRVR